MLHRVYERVAQARFIDEVLVATDDERIFQHVREFGGRVVMTRGDHPSGTDRVLEAAEGLTGAELVVNVQGDEPFIDPAMIDAVIELLKGGAEIATLAKRIRSSEDLIAPEVVKVVMTGGGDALYFSRSPIPHVRDAEAEKWLEAGSFFRHIGIYGFRFAVLRQIGALPAGRLEQLEKLEQLRWLENGRRIAVGITEGESIGIDTPGDLERARRFLDRASGGQ